MRIIVCIKQVPASNKVEVDPVTGVLKRDGALSKMNPYDLFALETALRLREAHGGTVDVITMGPPQAQKVIREAFSMGADNGCILSDRAFAGADVLATSYTLSQGIKKAGAFDIVLCGKQTTDGDTAQVGPETAERLSLPSISNVCEIISCDDAFVTVKMDMGDSVQTAKVRFPCLLCVDKDIYMPRLPSYVKAKQTSEREITFFSLADLDDKNPLHYGLSGSPTQVKRIFPPETNDGRECFNGTSDELAETAAKKLAELKFI